jgi:hypothetical protein
MRTAVVAAVAVAVLALPRPASAHIVTLNPGVKLGYTFGPNGGFTYGFEVAVNWMTPQIDWVIGSGVVLDFTWTRGDIFELRAGYEVYGLVWGLEIGPAVVMTPTGTHFAIDVTPYLSGIWVIPYYTASLAFGRGLRSELGTYLKLPICLHDDEGCYEGGSGGDWD